MNKKVENGKAKGLKERNRTSHERKNTEQQTGNNSEQHKLSSSFHIFYENISGTSAVSSTNFGSILIFASCVVGTCKILYVGEFFSQFICSVLALPLPFVYPWLGGCGGDDVGMDTAVVNAVCRRQATQQSS